MDFLLGHGADVCIFFLEGSILPQGKDSKSSPSPSLWTWGRWRRHISALPPKSICAATAYLTFQPM